MSLKSATARGMKSLQSASRAVKAFLTRREEGATMAEYALLVALIALVVIAGVTVFGTTLSTTFNDLAAKLSF